MLPVLILAAGESKRMGRPKATLPFRGVTFVRSIVASYSDLGFSPIIVVLGAHADTVREDLREFSVATVVNEAYREGQLSSIVAGLAAIDDRDVSGVFIHPVDHPLVSVQTIRRLHEAWDAGSHEILLPVHNGKRGHPVIFAGSLFTELRNAPPETGARSVVWARPDRVREVAVDDPGILQNIDTPEGYENIA